MSSLSFLNLSPISFGLFISSSLYRPFFAVVGIVISALTLMLLILARSNPLGVGITWLILSSIASGFVVMPLAGILILIAGILSIVEHHNRRKRRRRIQQRHLSDPSRRWKRWDRQGPPTSGPVPRTQPTVHEEESPRIQDPSFCPSCGSPLEPDDRFCVNCGSSKRG